MKGDCDVNVTRTALLETNVMRDENIWSQRDVTWIWESCDNWSKYLNMTESQGKYKQTIGRMETMIHN